MQALPLTTERQKTEWKTIKAIAQSNNFPDKVIIQLKSQIQQKTRPAQDNETNKKKQNQKTGSLHLSQPKEKKTDQLLQTHRRRYHIRKHKHNTAAHETKTTRKNTTEVEFTHSLVTHVNWHTSGKPAEI
jgi:hypothetical protein